MRIVGLANARPPIKAVAVAAILPQAGPVPFHPAPRVVRQSIILLCCLEVNVPGLVLSCTSTAMLEVIQSENGKKRRNAPPAAPGARGSLRLKWMLGAGTFPYRHRCIRAPVRADSFCAISRAMMSVGPATANCTITRTGRFG